MQWQGLALRATALWVALAPITGSAQTAPPTSTEQALQSLTARAAVIFAGTVTGIHRIAGDGTSSGAVEITFSVDQAVHGATAGSTYTVREWAGLWAANDQRYHVGQHLLMLLNAPGSGGLSSPVGGMDGAILILGAAPAVHAGSTVSAPAPAGIADLRWIAAQVVRPAAPVPVTGVHGTPIRGIARVQSEAFAVPTSTAAAPTQQAAVSTLVTLMTAWSAGHAR